MASFLTSTSLKPKPVEVAQNELSLKATELSWSQHLALPSPELKDILKPIIKDYKLSPTHLCHFLDITKGGPQQFMLERLLRFPSTTSVNAAYGSAIHATMQNLHGIYINQSQLPPLEDVFLIFENALKAQRLSSDEFAQLLQRGHDHLRIYLQERAEHFTKTQQSEITFSNQEVVLGQARLTGKIDLIDIDKEQKTVVVTDYKTAKPSTSWKGNSSSQKIQFHHYHQQLLFYKLLIDGSRDYSTYTVSAAQLDFIRPNSRGRIEPPLQAVISPDNMDRLTAIVEKVWQHIQDQNFPDTSNYDPSLRGVLAFEQDLIDGVI